MTLWLILSAAALLAALGPTLLFLRNLALYHPLAMPNADASRSPISVLIPARNEAANIAAAIASVQANDHPFELLILDDHSTDATAQIVRECAQRDPRIKLLQAPALPPGWCGKQHACHVLSQVASHGLLLFLDADVRLSPNALSRLATGMQSPHAASPKPQAATALLSGFPRQLTQTPLEQLLIPLMHFVLLGFLPLDRMRMSTDPALGAACGQLIMVRRDAYIATTGHAAIRLSLHDGLQLPRLFRRHGYATDLFDATNLATCRMYASAKEVWFGLAKNATEGLASPALIIPATLLLLASQVLPFVLVAVLLLSRQPHQAIALILALAAAVVAYLPRMLAVRRFRQPLIAALLHPVSILLFLAIQYHALIRKLCGAAPTWRGRSVTAAA